VSDAVGLVAREQAQQPPRPRRGRRRFDFTLVLKAYAQLRRRQLASQDPREAQQQVLRKLLAKAKDTRFGRDHGFTGIGSVADYQRAVPLRRFEALWQDYWQPAFPRLVDCTWPGTMPFFAQSSGTTTGVTKYIPCSLEILAANRRAMLDTFTHHLAHCPASTLLGGYNFMLGGSTQLTELDRGVWSGDLSGISSATAPLWARPFYFPPRHLEAIADWEEKIARMAPASLEVDIRSIGGTPSWLLLFLEKIASLDPAAPRRLAVHYPNLNLVVHGGINFAPYRSVFAEWLKGSRAETREVYPASEGFIAGADRGDGEGLRMVVDNGLFFEFVPVEELNAANPTRHWLGTVETGVNYALVLSTCAGLWGYVIGDTVRFVDRNPPRIVITGRTSYSLSAFGEHLIGEEIEKGVATAAAAIGADVCDYSAGALFPKSTNEAGGHLFVVEFAGAPPSVERIATFARVLDQTLAALNEDYKVHRTNDFGMRQPVVHATAPGTFAAWMKGRGKLGGQNKVPRVINDQALFDDLKTFAGWR
jgi:hypothetical protein